MRLWLPLSLILCNLIWSANPVMGKALIQSFLPLQVAWIRTAGAWAGLMVFHLARRMSHGRLGSRGGDPAPIFWWPKKTEQWFWLSMLGFSAFVFAPAFSMVGLGLSSAVDNSLLVALEPLATIALAATFLGETPRREQAVALFCALVGFSWLSGLNWLSVRASFSGHLIGNLLILASLLGEGAYSVCYRKIGVVEKALPIFTSALTLGTAGLTLLILATSHLPSLRTLVSDPRLLAATVWIGPIGTAATYLFWMKALEWASIPSMALSLFVQPFAGTVWGVLFFGESWAGKRVQGAIAIFLALSISAWGEVRHARVRSSPSVG